MSHDPAAALQGRQGEDEKTATSRGYIPLVLINYAFLCIGSVSSSLLSKYYFIHGGSNRWLSTWIQSSGFPLLIPPIYLPYYLFHSTDRKPFTHFSRPLFFRCILVGFMLGLNNLLFSWGNSYLPVSTSSLLLSTQLAFTLFLSVLITKQRLTFNNLNCVILLTFSSVLLALVSRKDKPDGLNSVKYFIGFFSTIGAGLLFALYLPIMERIYSKVYCYSMVLEMQIVMEIAATTLATAGMVSSGAFSHMAREANQVFNTGSGAYWATVTVNAVTWQLCFVGTAGMVFLTSSITGGICMTTLLAFNVLGGVAVNGDEFGGIKVVATLLCLWGFCSYVYGVYLKAEGAGGCGGDGGRGGTMEMMDRQGEETAPSV